MVPKAIFLLLSILVIFTTSCEGNLNNSKGQGSELPEQVSDDDDTIVSEKDFTVVETAPGIDEENVILRPEISIKLDEWADSANKISISIIPEVNGETFWDSLNKKVIYKVNQDLEKNQKYVASIVISSDINLSIKVPSKSVHIDTLSWGFQTMNNLAIRNCYPTGFAVPLDSKIEIEFDDSVSLMDVLLPIISVSVDGGDVFGNTKKINKGMKAEFIREQQYLEDNTEYTVDVSATYMTEDNVERNEKLKSWKFRTPDLWSKLVTLDKRPDFRDDIVAVGALGERIFMAGSENVGARDLMRIWFGEIDKNGNLLWDRTFLEKYAAISRDMFVDDSGLYIVGYMWNYSYAQDPIVIKYSLKGDFQWSETWNLSGVRAHDYAHAATLGNDKLIVAGSAGCYTYDENKDCYPFIVEINKDTGQREGSWKDETINGEVFDVAVDDVAGVLYAVGYEGDSSNGMDPCKACRVRSFRIWAFEINDIASGPIAEYSKTESGSYYDVAQSLAVLDGSIYVGGSYGGKRFWQKFSLNENESGKTIEAVQDVRFVGGDGEIKSIKAVEKDDGSKEIFVAGHVGKIPLSLTMEYIWLGIKVNPAAQTYIKDDDEYKNVYAWKDAMALWNMWSAKYVIETNDQIRLLKEKIENGGDAVGEDDGWISKDCALDIVPTDDGFITVGYVTNDRPLDGASLTYPVRYSDYRDGKSVYYLDDGSTGFAFYHDGKFGSGTSFSLVDVNAEGDIIVGGSLLGNGVTRPAAKVYSKSGDLKATLGPDSSTSWDSAHGVKIDQYGYRYLCGSKNSKLWVAKYASDNTKTPIWELIGENYYDENIDKYGNMGFCFGMALSDNYIYIAGQKSAPSATDSDSYRKAYVAKISRTTDLDDNNSQKIIWDDNSENDSGYFMYKRPVVLDNGTIMFYVSGDDEEYKLVIMSQDGKVIKSKSYEYPRIGVWMELFKISNGLGMLSLDDDAKIIIDKYSDQGNLISNAAFEIDGLETNINDYIVGPVEDYEGNIYFTLSRQSLITNGRMQGYIKQSHLIKYDNETKTMRVIRQSTPFKWGGDIALTPSGAIAVSGIDSMTDGSLLKIYDTNGNTVD